MQQKSNTFIEFGIGNTYILRTEYEYPDGTETEKRGIERNIDIKEFYIRIWINKTVYILSTKNGFNKKYKENKKIKLVFGIGGILSKT